MADIIPPLEQVKLFLGQFGPNCEVYTWVDDQGGLRVAEISWVEHRSDGSIAGSSYMQSDPDGLQVCAAAERLFLEYEGSGDDAALYEDMLRFLIGGEK